MISTDTPSFFKGFTVELSTGSSVFVVAQVRLSKPGGRPWRYNFSPIDMGVATRVGMRGTPDEELIMVGCDPNKTVDLPKGTSDEQILEALKGNYASDYAIVYKAYDDDARLYTEELMLSAETLVEVGEVLKACVRFAHIDSIARGCTPDASEYWP